MAKAKRKTASSTTTTTKPGTEATAPTGRESRKRMRRDRNNGTHDAGRSGAITTTGNRQTKQAAILGLLRRHRGASIADLTKATNWQPHSVRAALTGLRKKGHTIDRTKSDAGLTRYSIDEGR